MSVYGLRAPHISIGLLLLLLLLLCCWWWWSLLLLLLPIIAGRAPFPRPGLRARKWSLSVAGRRGHRL